MQLHGASDRTRAIRVQLATQAAVHCPDHPRISARSPATQWARLCCVATACRCKYPRASFSCAALLCDDELDDETLRQCASSCACGRFLLRAGRASCTVNRALGRCLRGTVCTNDVHCSHPGMYLPGACTHRRAGARRLTETPDFCGPRRKGARRRCTRVTYLIVIPTCMPSRTSEKERQGGHRGGRTRYIC